MGLLTFCLNVTLDGCIDHRVGIADDETHAFYTRLLQDHGAMLWGRVTYEMMEQYWPGVARGDTSAPPAMRAWATVLDRKPKFVVSSTRTGYAWTNSTHLVGELATAVRALKAATPLRNGAVALHYRRRAPDVYQTPLETASFPL